MREVEASLAEGVACERTYQVIVEGEPQPLLCRWFVPEPHPKGDWNCRVEVTWPDGRVRGMTSGGVDSAQALILAFSLVSTEILVSDKSIYWFDENDDLSLPCSAVHAEDLAARKARFDAK